MKLLLQLTRRDIV